VFVGSYGSTAVASVSLAFSEVGSVGLLGVEPLAPPRYPSYLSHTRTRVSQEQLIGIRILLGVSPTRVEVTLTYRTTERMTLERGTEGDADEDEVAL
jgi:hypothetical protein